MPTATKLPVLPIVREAYGIVLGNIQPLLALAAIPVVLTVVVWLVRVRLGGSTPVDSPAAGLNVWFYFEIFTRQLIWSVFAVSWHRYVLLGHRDTTSPFQFQLGPRELKFFLYSLVFLVPFMVMQHALLVTDETDGPIAMKTAFVVLGFAVAQVVVMVVWIRCLLIFPAVSVDGDEGLAAAWARLRGATWRLVFAGCLAMIPLALSVFIFWPLQERGHVDLAEFLGILLTFPLLAVGVSVLSLVYRHLTGLVPGRT